MNRLFLKRNDGVIPNMCLNVRLRCAESEKPASWAATVNETLLMMRSTASMSRLHRRYREIGIPVCSLKR